MQVVRNIFTNRNVKYSPKSISTSVQITITLKSTNQTQPDCILIFQLSLPKIFLNFIGQDFSRIYLHIHRHLVDAKWTSFILVYLREHIPACDIPSVRRKIKCSSPKLKVLALNNCSLCPVNVQPAHRSCWYAVELFTKETNIQTSTNKCPLPAHKAPSLAQPHIHSTPAEKIYIT